MKQPAQSGSLTEQRMTSVKISLYCIINFLIPYYEKKFKSFSNFFIF